MKRKTMAIFFYLLNKKSKNDLKARSSVHVYKYKHSLLKYVNVVAITINNTKKICLLSQTGVSVPKIVVRCLSRYPTQKLKRILHDYLVFLSNIGIFYFS